MGDRHYGNSGPSGRFSDRRSRLAPDSNTSHSSTPSYSNLTSYENQDYGRDYYRGDQYPSKRRKVAEPNFAENKNSQQSLPISHLPASGPHSTSFSTQSNSQNTYTPKNLPEGSIYSQNRGDSFYSAPTTFSDLSRPNPSFQPSLPSNTNKEFTNYNAPSSVPVSTSITTSKSTFSSSHGSADQYDPLAPISSFTSSKSTSSTTNSSNPSIGTSLTSKSSQTTQTNSGTKTLSEASKPAYLQPKVSIDLKPSSTSSNTTLLSTGNAASTNLSKPGPISFSLASKPQTSTTGNPGVLLTFGKAKPIVSSTLAPGSNLLNRNSPIIKPLVSPINTVISPQQIVQKSVDTTLSKAGKLSLAKPSVTIVKPTLTNVAEKAQNTLLEAPKSSDSDNKTSTSSSSSSSSSKNQRSEVITTENKFVDELAKQQQQSTNPSTTSKNDTLSSVVRQPTSVSQQPSTTTTTTTTTAKTDRSSVDSHHKSSSQHHTATSSSQRTSSPRHSSTSSHRTSSPRRTSSPHHPSTNVPKQSSTTTYERVHTKSPIRRDSSADSSKKIDNSDGKSSQSSSSKPTRIYRDRTIDAFTIISHISEGAYGIVHKAIDKETNTKVALKQVKIDPLKEKDTGFPISSIREIRILASLRHENIVNLRDVITDETGTTFYLVLDYVEHDLHEVLKRNRGKPNPFTLANIKSLVYQLLKAIDFLHSKNIMHRDIKSSNLLVSASGHLYLADFGLTKEYIPKANRTPTVVTLGYRAPELAFGAPDYGLPVDMWSIGCIMAELILGIPLIRVRTEIELISRLCEVFGSPNRSNYGAGYSDLGTSKPDSAFSIKNQPTNKLRDYFPDLSRVGFDLLNQLLCYDPDKRITSTQALAHAWFKEYPAPAAPIIPIDPESEFELATSMSKDSRPPVPPQQQQSHSKPTTEARHYDSRTYRKDDSRDYDNRTSRKDDSRDYDNRSSRKDSSRDQNDDRGRYSGRDRYQRGDRSPVRRRSPSPSRRDRSSHRHRF